MELNRVYTRIDIESMSVRLGYSVFDLAGGMFDTNGNTVCRCKWNSITEIKEVK
jgi:hypothetical protein